MRHRWTRGTPRGRPGAVAALVAVCLTVLVGIVALTLDGGMLFEDRRHAQVAADAAAFAGAIELAAHYAGEHGLDPNGTAKHSALTTAAANGFTTSNSTIAVNIPPASGPFTGVPGHVEVIIRYNQQRYFSAVWGSDTLTVYARGVARGQPGDTPNGIVLLKTTGSGTLNFSGNGNLAVNGPIYVNSSDPAAIDLGGNGALGTTAISVVGSPGINSHGNGGYTGTVTSSAPVLPDPYAWLPAPDPSTLTLQTVPSGSGTITLQPGRYVGGISASGDTYVLQPGIYYMDGGGFSFTGSGSLTGTGVTIYLANGAGFSLAGSGSVTLSAPISGLYQGIAVFTDRNASNINLAGQGAIDIDGVLYAPLGSISATGQGAIQTEQLVANTLYARGDGNFTVSPGKRNRVRLVE